MKNFKIYQQTQAGTQSFCRSPSLLCEAVDYADVEYGVQAVLSFEHSRTSLETQNDDAAVESVGILHWNLGKLRPHTMQCMSVVDANRRRYRRR